MKAEEIVRLKVREILMAELAKEGRENDTWEEIKANYPKCLSYNKGNRVKKNDYEYKQEYPETEGYTNENLKLWGMR